MSRRPSPARRRGGRWLAAASGRHWASGFELSKAEAAAEDLAPAALTPALSPGGVRHRHAGVCRCHSTAALCVAKAGIAPISRI